MRRAILILFVPATLLLLMLVLVFFWKQLAFTGFGLLAFRLAFRRAYPPRRRRRRKPRQESVRAWLDTGAFWLAGWNLRPARRERISGAPTPVYRVPREIGPSDEIPF